MTLVFYDDRPVFGGHEAMVLEGLEALLIDPLLKIHFIACEENSVLLKRLEALRRSHPSLTIEPTHEFSSRHEALRNRFTRGRVADLSVTLRRLEPDALIAIQSGIETSSLGILAARSEGIRAISYLAMPHSYQARGEKFGRFFDWGAPWLARHPDAFITSCQTLADHLRQRGARPPLEVIHSGIDTERFVAADRTSCRRTLGLSAEADIFGCVGRVQFCQKQQHLLVEAFSRTPTLAQAHLVVVGDGPDTEALDHLIQSRHLTHRVRRLPWVDTATFYPALDALVIPSRYEGLPLVMLEALACGTIVLGSDRDAMRDLLPPDRRFDPSSPESIGSALGEFLTAGRRQPPAELTRHVRETMSLPAFRSRFRQTLLRLAAPIPEPLSSKPPTTPAVR